MGNYADILRKDISFLKNIFRKSQEFQEEKRDKKPKNLDISRKSSTFANLI